MRKFSEATCRNYIRHIAEFAKFLGRSPDTATADDVRRFQVHLSENGARPSTLNSATSALRFFFGTETDIGRPRSINSSARTGNDGGLATPSAVCGSSCKKSGRPVDQPIDRHCADRVGCDYVETTNRSLDQIGLDAKRRCLAQQPSHR